MEEVKKILIKNPPLFEDAFSVFPFLIALSEEFPKAEINVIAEEGTGLAFSFLPFKVRVFERPKDKTSLIQTHQYCANLNDVFNIDLFFDLENSFNSSFMGFNFRSVERIGYGIGWNKYFLTKNYAPELVLTLERKCVKLLENYTAKNFDQMKISRIRTEGQIIEKVEQLFAEPEQPKFIMIMLDNFQKVANEINLWTKFFDSFENQKFVIWSMNDEDMISELFSKIDLGKNSLYMHRGQSHKEVIYLLNKVKGVVTNNIWAEGLCTYSGVENISFFDSQLKTLPEYHYFQFKPQRFFFTEGAPTIRYVNGEEEKILEEMNQVVDHIHFNFKL